MTKVKEYLKFDPLTVDKAVFDTDRILIRIPAGLRFNTPSTARKHGILCGTTCRSSNQWTAIYETFTRDCEEDRLFVVTTAHLYKPHRARVSRLESRTPAEITAALTGTAELSAETEPETVLRGFRMFYLGTVSDVMLREPDLRANTMDIASVTDIIAAKTTASDFYGILPDRISANSGTSGTDRWLSPYDLKEDDILYMMSKTCTNTADITENSTAIAYVRDSDQMRYYEHTVMNGKTPAAVPVSLTSGKFRMANPIIQTSPGDGETAPPARYLRDLVMDVMEKYEERKSVGSVYVSDPERFFEYVLSKEAEFYRVPSIEATDSINPEAAYFAGFVIDSLETGANLYAGQLSCLERAVKAARKRADKIAKSWQRISRKYKKEIRDNHGFLPKGLK